MMNKIRQHSLSILAFHALDNEPSAISFPAALFRAVMANLHRHGYRAIALDDAVEALREQRDFPTASFVITFDDGYQSVYQHAFPVLQELGFAASIFITVGSKTPTDSATQLPQLEGRAMLSWREIEEMHRYGITIGSHTMTHPDLTRLPDLQLKAELSRSKSIIEDRLGSSIDSFAYPYGYYDQRSRAVVEEHYQCACTTELGLINLNSDCYRLARVETYYLRSERLFGLIETPLFPWYLGARRIPRLIRQRFMRGRM